MDNLYWENVIVKNYFVLLPQQTIRSFCHFMSVFSLYTVNIKFMGEDKCYVFAVTVINAFFCLCYSVAHYTSNPVVEIVYL